MEVRTIVMGRAADIQGSCVTKKRYGEESMARKVANKRMAAGSVRLWYYGCTNCGGYHLTKQPPEGS